MSEKNEKKPLSFEAALARLEKIVEKMDSGEEPLEKMLSLFEEGVGLVRQCTEILDGAEKKVKLLVKEGENVNETDFTEADGEC